MTMKDGTCPTCGSDNIIPDLHIHTGDSKTMWVKLTAPSQPGKFIQKVESEIQPIHARVCGACGHVELFIEAADRMWQGYQQGWK